MKIIQLVNGYSKGDGVGNVITVIDKLLTRNGYTTEIYNQTLNLSDIDNEDFCDENIVLYHVALSVDPLVRYLKCKKILVFHNITDPELLIGSGLAQMRNWCSAGLYDVQGLKPYFESAIVFSNYSKKTLVDCGWDSENIYQMPIIVRFENLAQEYDTKLVEKYRDGFTNIIFTGRVFPNKKQEDIIYSFNAYKKNYNKKSRLFIVGSVGNENYFKALKELAKRLEIEEDVIFTGRAPFNEYLAYYQLADVFLCMSAHEGFCIPIVEALFFNVPIVAVASTAIPDTLGGSGLLLNTREPEIVAEALNSITSGNELRKTILEKQKKRLEELQPENIEKQYIDVLNKCVGQKNTKTKYKKFESTRVLNDGIAFPDKLYDGVNVIYGFGAAGNRLLGRLETEGIPIAAVCDQNKAGTKEKNIDIISPQEAFNKYKNSNFIVSIQDKKILKKVICMLLANGIEENKILIFDEIKDEIV